MTPSKVVRDGDGRWSNADRDRIEIAEPDPSWPERFAEEAAAIRRVLPAGVRARIEHVGSTAVPGLAAKPVIDILLVPAGGARRPELIAPLESLGYAYWADDPRPDRMFFVKGMPPYGERRTHHVHVRTAAEAAEVIAFRDHLRSDPEEAARYARLKRRLAAQYPDDRDAYTAGKDAYLATVHARIARP